MFLLLVLIVPLFSLASCQNKHTINADGRLTFNVLAPYKEVSHKVLFNAPEYQDYVAGGGDFNRQEYLFIADKREISVKRLRYTTAVSKQDNTLKTKENMVQMIKEMYPPAKIVHLKEEEKANFYFYSVYCDVDNDGKDAIGYIHLYNEKYFYRILYSSNFSAGALKEFEEIVNTVEIHTN